MQLGNVPIAVWAPILIILGLVYLLKPTLFMRWFWKRTAVSQRLLTPEQNVIYMRVLGAVFVLIGLCLLIRLAVHGE